MRAPSAVVPALVLALAAGPLFGAEGPWLSVMSPPEDESQVSLSLLEVRGAAGTRGTSAHDLVICLDLSDSTIQPSGADLDGDGAAGSTRPEVIRRLSGENGVRSGLVERLSEVDFDDSILVAEIEAARALIARLDLRRFRVGLVTFSDRAWLVAPVGSSRSRLDIALDRVERNFFRELRGTNLAAAVTTAHQALTARRTRTAEPRERSILILSDGSPTLPVHGRRAEEAALEAARQASAAGIRIYSFALGPEAVLAVDVYRTMAELTGGRLERIARPGDAIARLRRVDLAGLEAVEIENLSTGRAARAVRVFPDGSFDAFVFLHPGRNRLRVRARTSDGDVQEVARTVRYQPPDDAERGASRREARALLEELRRRTRQTELWAEVERGRHAQRQEVELEAERPGS